MGQRLGRGRVQWGQWGYRKDSDEVGIRVNVISCRGPGNK